MLYKFWSLCLQQVQFGSCVVANLPHIAAHSHRRHIINGIGSWALLILVVVPCTRETFIFKCQRLYYYYSYYLLYRVCVYAHSLLAATYEIVYLNIHLLPHRMHGKILHLAIQWLSNVPIYQNWRTRAHLEKYRFDVSCYRCYCYVACTIYTAMICVSVSFPPHLYFIVDRRLNLANKHTQTHSRLCQHGQHNILFDEEFIPNVSQAMRRFSLLVATALHPILLVAPSYDKPKYLFCWMTY